MNEEYDPHRLFHRRVMRDKRHHAVAAPAVAVVADAAPRVLHRRWRAVLAVTITAAVALGLAAPLARNPSQRYDPNIRIGPAVISESDRAKMATAYLEPNTTGANPWDALGGAGGAGTYTMIAKATQQPTAPSTATGIDLHTYGQGDGTNAEFGFATTTVGSVSQIKIWIYGFWQADDGGDWDISINTGGGFGTPVQLTAAGTAWYSATFTDTYTQGQLDALTVKLAGLNQDSSWMTAYAVYAEITYTAGGGAVGSQTMVIIAGAGNV